MGPGLVLIDRPDLSRPGCETREIRFRAHDGERLWGLISRCSLHHTEGPARLRVIGSCERPEVDRGCLEDGFVDLLLQEPSGRRLEDRVLDVLRLFELTDLLDWIDQDRVFPSPSETDKLPDELLIAEQLRFNGPSIGAQTLP